MVFVAFLCMAQGFFPKYIILISFKTTNIIDKIDVKKRVTFDSVFKIYIFFDTLHDHKLTSQ